MDEHDLDAPRDANVTWPLTSPAKELGPPLKAPETVASPPAHESATVTLMFPSGSLPLPPIVPLTVPAPASRSCICSVPPPGPVGAGIAVVQPSTSSVTITRSRMKPKAGAVPIERHRTMLGGGGEDGPIVSAYAPAGRTIDEGAVDEGAAAPPPQAFSARPTQHAMAACSFMR